jgi:hypothetical protein
MGALLSVRTNIRYAKEVVDGVEKYIRSQELIFLVDKPEYSFTNEGTVVRSRAINEFRCDVGDKGLEQLIELLTKLKDVEPSDLE